MKTMQEIDTLLEQYRTRLKALEQEYQMAQGAIAALEWTKLEEATKNEKDKPKDSKKA